MHLWRIDASETSPAALIPTPVALNPELPVTFAPVIPVPLLLLPEQLIRLPAPANPSLVSLSPRQLVAVVAEIPTPPAGKDDEHDDDDDRKRNDDDDDESVGK